MPEDVLEMITDYEVQCDECGYIGFRLDCLNCRCPNCNDLVRRLKDPPKADPRKENE